MAIIDNEREVIVVRIVYDGPPLSGKTTSLYSLGKILGQSRKVYTPNEVEGHTIFFDWLDYTGGYFKGNSISCQIVTMPGQNILKEHREFLLRSADAIIFVLDATHTEQSTLDYFWQTQQILEQVGETVKIVIQANKQDLPGALSSQQLKALFSEYPSVKVIESSATLGKGIRESFVLAVRLATERASSLMERGKLAIGRPEIIDGESLLAQLKNTVEIKTLPNDTLPTETILPATEIALSVEGKESMVTHLPQLPDESTAPQWLWPPLLGKKMLMALLKNQLKPHLKYDKTWIIDSSSGWRCFSKADWYYTDPTVARAALRTYIKLHLQCSPFLSEQRCVALAQDEQQWRLWQILHKVPTLTDKLQQALQHKDIHQLAEEVVACAQHYVHAQQQATHYSPEFNLSLDNIGLDSAEQLIYLGCIDNGHTPHRLSETDIVLIEALKQAFSAPITEHAQSLDVMAICTEIENIPLEQYNFIPKVISESFFNVSST